MPSPGAGLSSRSKLRWSRTGCHIPTGSPPRLAIENEIRQGGAIPATIGILRGAIRVGLTNAELNELATTPGIVKVNLSNLAATVAAGRPGATTVAATMFAAHAKGIRVFATGGIGGVHRDASISGDVSADLTALSRIPIAVVCAGAKAILDLPRTVEMLETLGVPVFGLQTNEFPAFYRRSSGLPVDQADGHDRGTGFCGAHALCAGPWNRRADRQSHSRLR